MRASVGRGVGREGGDKALAANTYPNEGGIGGRGEKARRDRRRKKLKKSKGKRNKILRRGRKQR